MGSGAPSCFAPVLAALIVTSVWARFLTVKRPGRLISVLGAQPLPPVTHQRRTRASATCASCDAPRCGSLGDAAWRWSRCGFAVRHRATQAHHAPLRSRSLSLPTPAPEVGSVRSSIPFETETPFPRATRGALAGSVRCLSGNERRSRPSGRLRHVDQHHSRFGWAFEWSGSLRARCWTSSIPPAGMAINFARSRRQCTASIPSARHGECQTCGHGGELVRPSELGVARGGWRATVSPRVWRGTIAAAGCLSACSGRGCTRR